MTDVTIHWAGPADAASASTYKVERTLDIVSWTTLAAAQAATSPYVSVSSTLNGNHAYGAATVSVTSATSFATSGYAWLDDALIEWAGKSSNDLTGVTWHSGYGTYATGTAVYVAHESYADTGISITLNAVLYRITHTNAAGEVSAPTYLWYYSPPTPASADHCVVIVNVMTDLGFEARDGVYVDVYLTTDTDFATTAGGHLDAEQSTAKRQTTNAFGLAFFQCWRSAARAVNTAYTFLLDASSADSLEKSVATIPERDWVMLVDLL